VCDFSKSPLFSYILEIYSFDLARAAVDSIMSAGTGNGHLPLNKAKIGGPKDVMLYLQQTTIQYTYTDVWVTIKPPI